MQIRTSVGQSGKMSFCKHSDLTAKDKTKKEELQLGLLRDLGYRLGKASVSKFHLPAEDWTKAKVRPGSLAERENGTHQIQLRQSQCWLPRAFWLVAKVKSISDKGAEGENTGSRGWAGGRRHSTSPSTEPPYFSDTSSITFHLPSTPITPRNTNSRWEHFDIPKGKS